MKTGEWLRQVRYARRMSLREVEERSRKLAFVHRQRKLVVPFGRLADYEKGIVPNIYRAYSLAAIYDLDMKELLQRYGVPL